jgi:hypothetical protein
MILCAFCASRLLALHLLVVFYPLHTCLSGALLSEQLQAHLFRDEPSNRLVPAIISLLCSAAFLRMLAASCKARSDMKLLSSPHVALSLKEVV